MHPQSCRGSRVGLGMAALAAALTLAPATALGAGTAPTTTTVDSVSPVQTSLQPYTVTATVRSSGAPLTGVVFFRNQIVFDSPWQPQFGILGGERCPGTSSTCTVSVTPNILVPKPDVNKIYAYYEGDDVNAASQSEPVEVSVDIATTTPTITQRASTTVYGQPLLIDASLALDAPSTYPEETSWFQRKSLWVTDVASGQRWTSSSSSNRSVTEVRGLSAGTHRLSAEFDDHSLHPFPVALPAPVLLDHVVQKASTMLDLAAEPAGEGRARLSAKLATVAPGAGTGTGQVTFTEGETVVGTANVGADGTATAEVALPAGDHTIRASYAGDGNFNASQSPTKTVAVTAPSTGGGSGGGGGPVATPRAGELLKVTARPSGRIVARVTCDDGRATLRAKLDGKVFAQRSVRCRGGRMRIALRPQRVAYLGQKVRVSVRFTEGGHATTKVRVPRDA